MPQILIPLNQIPIHPSLSPADSRQALGLIRGVLALCQALDVEPDVLYPYLLAHWWTAWEAHPDYANTYAPDAHGYAPSFHLLQPQVMGVWRHPPGRGGHNESYVISTPQDVLASLAWGNRTFGGTFAGIQPIHPSAPVSRYRIVTWAFSYKGAGGAYVARMRLKALLPREVHPWISKARSTNSRPKHHLYPFPVDPRRIRYVPPVYDSYRTRSKGEIWLEEKMPAAVRQAISRYLEPIDFWRCATGRVHPDEVEPLIQAHIRQTWADVPPPIAKPTVTLPEHLPRWREYLSQGLTLF